MVRRKHHASIVATAALLALASLLGVASVPGSSFYRNPASGRTKVRFCFCKKDETLSAAEERLKRILAIH